MISNGEHDDPTDPLLANVRNWQLSLDYKVLIFAYELGNPGTGIVEIIWWREFCFLHCFSIYFSPLPINFNYVSINFSH